MYVRERNQNGDCGTGPRLLFCQFLFMTYASCFISTGHNNVANIFIYFLCMKQQEETQMEAGIFDQEDHECQIDKEELGA